MKILLVSSFPPSLGGIETMAVLIAREWSGMPGLKVKVVTTVEGPALPGAPFELVRKPSVLQLHRLYQWADAVFFNHCYLKLAAPLVWIKKPYVVSMSGMMDAVHPTTVGGKIRKSLLVRQIRKADVNIAACRAVQLGNGVPAEVIPNPFDQSIYFRDPAVTQHRDFFFGGRINQEAKGCMDLMEAFVGARKRTGLDLTLSVAGNGPGLAGMIKHCEESGVSDKVRFLGVLSGAALARRCVSIK